MKVTIKASPGAKKNALVGWESHPDCTARVLRVKIAAPPLEGKANKELISYLARCLQIRKSALTLIHGESGRLKIIELPDEAVARLNALLDES